MTYTTASIVPLIGGETIAQQNVFGVRPEYIMTYSAFAANETHLRNYYNNEVPYLVLDEGTKTTPHVDVVNTVCPCAGLSSLSPSASSTNKMNECMFTSAEHVLSVVKPKVFWGENAPRLASKMGEPVVRRLRKIAEDNGYSMSIFKTKSILHGLSQVRDRTFYFFWQGDRVPVFDYIGVEHERIEDTILSCKPNPNDPMSNILTNNRKPTDNPFYKYVLDVIEGGITHQQFFEKIERTTNPLDYIEANGIKYRKVAEWMRENGYEREAAKADRMHHKLASGGNIMRKTTEIPKDYIGAFVGHMPTQLTHPDIDRYLTVREALTIMKMPSDYQLLNPAASLNHICQNVPVTTAEFAAKMVKKHLDGLLDTVETKFALQCNKSKTFIPEINVLSLEEFM